ncbi:hypothetical protein F4775DRAFT_582523 [Biscogniauxia sp. FL1348]|nr:hypothetical protein F4775DRAFT_582523 [Biscogniauxia sp. FL1348]
MFERLLTTAKELGEMHSPPDIPEALSQAVPELATIRDVRDLLAQEGGADAATQSTQDSIAVLWAAYAVLKSDDGILKGEEDGAPDTLSEIADTVGKIMAPVCPVVEADEDDTTNYAPLILKGTLGLHILDLITRSRPPSPSPLPPTALLSIVAYTRAADPWTAGASAALAQSLLRAHFPPGDRKQQQQDSAEAKFIADDVLAGFLRPLFSRSRPAGITASGRKAEFAEPARYHVSSTDTEPAVKPWKYARRYAITVFEWAIERADRPLIQSSWPLFTPVLLALLDDPQAAIKQRGLRALRAFWARQPPALMRDTGLAPVFAHAVFPAVLNLPSLTPEPESVALLAAAYPALFDMAGVERSENENENENDDDGETKTETKIKTKKFGDFTEEQRALVDRIVREGIMTGYHHAKEHVRLVSLLCEELRRLVDGIGILAVKYLKDFVPMTSEILTDPFGTKHPPSLLAAVRLLQEILRSCWPRIPGRDNEIIKTLMLCWLNIDDDEDAFPADSKPSPAELRAELAKTAQMLSAIMKVAGVDMSERVGPLIEKEPQLSALFQDYSKAA